MSCSPYIRHHAPARRQPPCAVIQFEYMGMVLACAGLALDGKAGNL